MAGHTRKNAVEKSPKKAAKDVEEKYQNKNQ